VLLRLFETRQHDGRAIGNVVPGAAAMLQKALEEAQY